MASSGRRAPRVKADIEVEELIRSLIAAVEYAVHGAPEPTYDVVGVPTE